VRKFDGLLQDGVDPDADNACTMRQRAQDVSQRTLVHTHERSGFRQLRARDSGVIHDTQKKRKQKSAKEAKDAYVKIVRNYLTQELPLYGSVAKNPESQIRSFR